jgi:hypothetical protein
MDLMERYLAAIARELPKAKAADITAELRDMLLSQVEAREAELGRKLTRDELEAVLKAFGHPLIVASRYERPRYLIGPEVFPFWWSTLRLVMAIAGGIFVALLVIRMATSEAPVQRVIDQAGPAFWSGFLMLFGGVTLAFVVAERVGISRWLSHWRPRDLPASRARNRNRFEIATQIAMGGVFLLWWTHVIHFRNLLPFPPTMRVELAPVWMEFYWPIIAFSAGEMAINGLELMRPGMERTIAVLNLLKNLAGAAILGQIWQARHFVNVSSTALPAGQDMVMQSAFDMALTMGLGVTMIVFACKAAYHLWRLVRASGPLVGALA